MGKQTAAFILSLTLCGAVTLSAQAQTLVPVPIMLHPDSDHGTCSAGLQVNVDGAALRAGPGEQYPIIERLPAGQIVAGCDAQPGWDGVIKGQGEACSVGIFVPRKTPYDGPCTSGWIDQRFLTQIFG